MSTKQKSPFFDGGWSQISRWNLAFSEKFLDFFTLILGSFRRNPSEFSE
jgi:hypothetical protein